MKESLNSNSTWAYYWRAPTIYCSIPSRVGACGALPSFIGTTDGLQTQFGGPEITDQWAGTACAWDSV